MIRMRVMRRNRLWIYIPVLLALGGAGYWYGGYRPAAPVSPERATAPAIPVIATIAQTQNVSDYLIGLGTVQAFNRVTVHVRVDGELQDIRFTEGQFVHAGDLLARIDPRLFQAALDQAKAKKAQDQALLISAQKDLGRAKALIDKNFQTQQVVDQTQARVDQLIASVDADQAMIENADTELSYTTISSPIDGRMGMRLIDRGNLVHASDPGGLVVITQVQPIAVIFSLPQDYLQNITAAMKQGDLKVTAYSRDNTTTLGEGTLLLIDNQIDAATGTLRLKASFPNPDDKLWPGQFVNARLELAVRRGTVAVPAQVIQRGPDGLYAYVIRQDQTVEHRTIKVGPVRDGLAVIESGLASGERVIVDGQFKTRPGAKVSVTMMPAPQRGTGADKAEAQALPDGEARQSQNSLSRTGPSGRGTPDNAGHSDGAGPAARASPASSTERSERDPRIAP
jgi:membrane fusion protein, multidrug efflux system